MGEYYDWMTFESPNEYTDNSPKAEAKKENHSNSLVDKINEDMSRAKMEI